MYTVYKYNHIYIYQIYSNTFKYMYTVYKYNQIYIYIHIYVMCLCKCWSHTPISLKLPRLRSLLFFYLRGHWSCNTKSPGACNVRACYRSPQLSEFVEIPT